MSTCPSMGLPLSHTSLYVKCYHPHTSTVPSFLLALAIPHVEVCSLSPYVNNTWPLRFRMWGENKIRGLGCFSVWSPPGTLTLTPSGLLLRGILSDILQHTVIGSPLEYIQEHIYKHSCMLHVCRSVRPECKIKCELCGYDTAFSLSG